MLRSKMESKCGFSQEVMFALKNLYDGAALQRSALVDLVVDHAASTVDKAISVRTSILRIIRSLRPAQGVPTDTADWRRFRVLQLRYVEGMSPAQAMLELGLARSQYYAAQAEAISYVIDLLWDELGDSRVEAKDSADEARLALLRDETNLFSTRADWGLVDATEVLEELRAVIHKLAALQRVEMRYDFGPDPLVVQRCNRILLRQVILSLVEVAFGLKGVRSLLIASVNEHDVVGVKCSVIGDSSNGGVHLAQALTQHVRGLEGLVEILGAEMSCGAPTRDCAEVQLVWSKGALPKLLVVDDNDTFVVLYRRLLASAGWHVIGASSAAEARLKIEAECPTAIMIDVLMPEEDGWDFLASLKSDSLTRHIPVIVCSVLDQPCLALSLGANDSLTKPVTAESLRACLARWA